MREMIYHVIHKNAKNMNYLFTLQRRFKNITLNEGNGYMLNKFDTLDHIVDGFAFYNVSLVLQYNSPFSSKKSE